MPRHRNLNLKKFIDAIPENLINEYFRKKVADQAQLPLTSFDFASLQEYFDSAGDEELKKNIREDFTHVNDISEKVMNILIRAVHRYNIGTTGEEKREQLAIDIFLHHPEAFDYAYDYYCYFNSTSKMSQYKIDADNFGLNPQKLGKFENMIREFYSKLAKGKQVQVRHYEEDDSVVIVIIRGSYTRSLPIWEKNEIKTLHFRPATEDILFYDKETSILTVKTPYQKDKDNYIKVFTEALVEDESQAERSDRDNTYSLKPLQNGTFSFAGSPKITSIKLLEVKIAIRGITNPEVVIKSSDVMDTLKKDINGINMSSGELMHAKFRFTLKINSKRRKVTFEITPPNVTDLTKKKYSDIINAYLKENGVKLV